MNYHGFLVILGVLLAIALFKGIKNGFVELVIGFFIT
jgi:hypothetical protein